MPPVSNKSKGGKLQSRDGRRSRSRNTTPISAGTAGSAGMEPSSGSYLQTAIGALSSALDITLESTLDNGGSASMIPIAKDLDEMRNTVKDRFLPHIRIRGEVCDRLMRELSRRRKERMEQEREKERVSREAEERKHKLKKVKKREPDEDRPLAVGAHGMARQDGVDVHKDASSTISSPVSQAAPSTDLPQLDNAPSPSASEASHQPSPLPSVPQFQAFGSDPSTFDDPTIYHIREVTPGMTEKEKKEIFCVASYPESDLHDLTPGTPPDKDFSNAKPPAQTSASVFANYVEPYIRPLTEEDMAFLKERGDRVTPFLMPRRGTRHYKEIWADEDGAMALDPLTERLPPNEPRGSIDMLSDEVLETEELSTGPVIARLLATMRVEGRNPDSATMNGETNGMNGDVDMDADGNDDPNRPPPPATHMPESMSSAWKAAAATPTPRPDYAALDERVLQELKHIGFLGDSDTPQYDAHFDDEVAERLRFLQAELKRVSVQNGARKARLLELTEERMAMQEYNNIADDLDSQLNAAYLKRNRNIGKGKKNVKRPGGAGGGSHIVPGLATAKVGVGEPIRLLMERKEQWNSKIGPVVNWGKATLPTESIFRPEAMAKYEEKELEGWNEVEE